VNQPDFLVIGHVTKDLTPHGFNVGGTATYASITAHNLGYRAAIVTSAGPDVDLDEALPGISVARVHCRETTTFQNIYQEGRRRQFVRAVAAPLTPEAIPPQWRRVPIVLLGPLAQEFGETVVELFPAALIGVTPQGWMRQWDSSGSVSPCPWAGGQYLLPKADVLTLSEEDVGGDLSVIQEYVNLTRIVVVTSGWQGSTVYFAGEVRWFPTRPVVEVDPTGAGDVFTAAYLVRLWETEDPWEAARFANIVASFSVEGPGVTAIPVRAQVEGGLVTNPLLGGRR
jgi:sugar/nucleoside kinase (ribokinase family)